MHNTGFRRSCDTIADQGTIGGVVESVHPGGPDFEELFVSVTLHTVDADGVHRCEAPEIACPGSRVFGLIDLIDAPE